ncbi:hypothetical protein FKM82_015428 [Ascaphus truei]
MIILIIQNTKYILGAAFLFIFLCGSRFLVQIINPLHRLSVIEMFIFGESGFALFDPQTKGTDRSKSTQLFYPSQVLTHIKMLMLQDLETRDLDAVK